MTTESTLITAITLTIVGVLVIAIRKLKIKGTNEYILDSIEWLILGTAPLIPASELLTSHTEWRDVFIGAYCIVIVSWFVILLLTKKENPKKAKQAIMFSIPTFGIGIFFVIKTWLTIT